MGSNAKILIVDDEAHIRLLIAQTLEELEDGGVTIFSAEDGEQALTIAQVEHPNLIFLDVMLPKLNGFDTCKKIKQDLGMHDTTVVMLTAKGQEFDRKRGLDAGADYYVTKPFDPDDLLALAKKIID